jgi:GNAT superfamily N-acetyltransferase
MHFDADYREHARLGDGAEVTLRLVRHDDQPLIREGFEALSPETRYRRFLEARTRLTPAELDYLTDVDGDRHFAIGALVRGPDGREHGAGVARFVRLADRPEVAEPAITVVDAWQGRGLGRLLAARLAAAANERGVRRFRSSLLATNRPVRGLIEEGAPDAEVQADGEVLTVEFPVPHVEPAPAAPQAHKASLFRLLALAARKLLQ